MKSLGRQVRVPTPQLAHAETFDPIVKNKLKFLGRKNCFTYLSTIIIVNLDSI